MIEGGEETQALSHLELLADEAAKVHPSEGKALIVYQDWVQEASGKKHLLFHLVIPSVKWNEFTRGQDRFSRSSVYGNFLVELASKLSSWTCFRRE